MKILAIETSCDETAIAIIETTGLKKKPVIHVLSHIVASQVKLHAEFGGVVPNLARREHQKNLVPILEAALSESGICPPRPPRPTRSESRLGNRESGTKISIPNSKFKILNSILNREPELLKQFEKNIIPLSPPNIDAIAVTYGPGLAPALWVGVNFARALSYLWKKPLISVNHMEGHIVSALLHTVAKKQRQNSMFQVSSFKFPALALLVSGGHTELVVMKKIRRYHIIGETLDDAAGEAFDKVARILGLSYPGGPEIAAEAAKMQNAKIKMKNYKAKFKIFLPRPMLGSQNYDFSFSGLKTAVLYLVRNLEKQGYSIKKFHPAITKEFQDAVVEVLVAKTIRAAKTYSANTILLGGGVAANKELRRSLQEHIKKELPQASCMLPDVVLTGDNALMIAVAAALTGKKKAWTRVHADANARLGQN